MGKGKHLAAKTRKRVFGTASSKAVKPLLIILIALAAIVLITFVAVWFFAKSKVEKMNYVPEEISEETGEPVITIIDSIPEQVVIDEGNGEQIIEQTLVEKEVELPKGETIEEEHILNILLVGTDQRDTTWDDPGRADVTMLCSIDKKAGTIKLISFERSIMVPIPGKGSDLLTHSYVWGGMNLLLKDLQDCFLLNIDGYMHVDFDTFRQMINAMGGVQITLTAEEAEALNKWGVSYELYPGTNILDGYSALRYCRLRKIDSNFGRIERQRKTVQALMDKAKTMSLAELNNMVDEVLPLIDTNIPSDVFLSLLASAPNFIGVVAEQYQVPEGNDSSRIDLNYEADRLKTIIYGEQ